MTTRVYKTTATGTERGKCQRCGKILALNVKGKLRRHQDRIDRYPFRNVTCYGSNQLPVTG